MAEQTEHAVIDRELAAKAVAVLEELLDGEREEQKRDGVRHRAAESLVRLWQTQAKYPSERVKELAAAPKASQNVRELANLTDDELNALTEQMLAEGPRPWKPQVA